MPVAKPRIARFPSINILWIQGSRLIKEAAHSQKDAQIRFSEALSATIDSEISHSVIIQKQTHVSVMFVCTCVCMVSTKTTACNLSGDLYWSGLVLPITGASALMLDLKRPVPRPQRPLPWGDASGKPESAKMVPFSPSLQAHA